VNSKLVIGVVLAASAYWLVDQYQPHSLADTQSRSESASDAVDRAFENRQSNVQVSGRGEVIKLLSDDTKGSRHQRFILRLASGRTLLISHNIDLAPRIDTLKVGDHVEFFGEYEWNDKGGLIHWTHDDPQGRHVDGWVKHQGKAYQ
jgi:Protein of unknown function (DUF3465)